MHVDEREASERTRRLLGSVERSWELLHEVGDSQWKQWLDAVHRDLIAHDAHGLDRLLQGFGGMGSFNDLVIRAENGHSVTGAEVEAVNTELAQLRSAMYDDARALRNDLDRRL